MARHSLESLTRIAREFRDARNWRQFHSAKELAISMSVEAAELLEHMLWHDGPALQTRLRSRKAQIGEELSDVLHAMLLLADELRIDLGDAFVRKMNKNRRKYPVGKSRNSARKYNEL